MNPNYKLFLLFLMLFAVNGWDFDLGSWMKTASQHEAFRQKRLNEITLPSTHDSGTYHMENYCIEGACPAEELDTVQDVIQGTSPTLSELYGGFTEAWAKCQTDNVYEQLKAGVRFLDIRPAWDHRQDKFVTQHSYAAAPLDEIFTHIRDFVNENDQEIVVVGIENYYLHGKESELEDMIDEYFQGIRWTSDDLPTVKEMQVSDERVLFSCKENSAPGSWCKQFRKTDYADSMNVQEVADHNSAQVESYETMADNQYKDFMWEISWCLTPSTFGDMSGTFLTPEGWSALTGVPLTEEAFEEYMNNMLTPEGFAEYMASDAVQSLEFAEGVLNLADPILPEFVSDAAGDAIDFSQDVVQTGVNGLTDTLNWVDDNFIDDVPVVDDVADFGADLANDAIDAGGDVVDTVGGAVEDVANDAVDTLVDVFTFDWGRRVRRQLSEAGTLIDASKEATAAMLPWMLLLARDQATRTGIRKGPKNVVHFDDFASVDIKSMLQFWYPDYLGESPLYRQAVPDQGACDGGLPGAECGDCTIHYDDRDQYGNNEMGKCIWVPSEQQCYPKGHAASQGWDVDEYCTGIAAPVELDFECICHTPGQGTTDFNKWQCADQSSGYCAEDEECSEHNVWMKSDLNNVCRVPVCTCTNPDSPNAAENGFYCSDSTSSYCAVYEVCASNGVWDKTQASQACVAKTCTCDMPGAGTNSGLNKYTCYDGSSAFCGAGEECYATTPFLQGSWSQGCRVPITCSCQTPGTGTVDHNGYECTDGSSAWCQLDQECYKTTSVALASASELESQLCREPDYTCSCDTPGAGTAGNNKYSCTDQSSSFCASDEECYKTSSVDISSKSSLCRKPVCTCKTPNQGASGNGYECSDNTSGFCANDEECYSTGVFTKGSWSQGCRVPPTCSCKTPGQGTDGKNGISCTDGFSPYCAANEECYKTNSVARASYAQLCRVPKCSCKTPGTGTSGSNGYHCTDGSSAWCQPAQECYKTNTVLKTSLSQLESQLCRIPNYTCKCETPGKGTSGKNQYTCTDTSSGYCASNEECYKTGIVPIASKASLCRKPVCTCKTPKQGTSGNNEYECSDGSSGYCDPNQECYATGSFTKFSWSQGCRVPPTCKCTTPGQGTIHKNGISCTDGFSPYCASNQECYQTNSVARASYTSLCRVPKCSCTTPGTGTVNKNGYKCTDGSNGWCSSSQECYKSTSYSVQKSSSSVMRSKLCRKPDYTCKCQTPGEGTSGKNRYTCTDQSSGYCASSEECYKTGSVAIASKTSLCRKPKCSCKTPKAGTSGKNEYTCTDGSSGACDSNQECYATGTFTKGSWSNGCRTPPSTKCSCKTPGKGTSGKNKYTCTDGSSGYCSSNQECYKTSSVLKSSKSSLCRKPRCTCKTPKKGTAGKNGFECTDGFNGWCAGNEECYKTSSFTKGSWSQGCRKPGAEAAVGSSLVDSVTSNTFTSNRLVQTLAFVGFAATLATVFYKICIQKTDEYTTIEEVEI